QNGLFTDNAKHFYLYLCTNATPQPDVIYLVFSRETYRLLANSRLPVCFYPGLRSIVYLLTANMVVVDSAEWITHGKFQLAFRSKVIQLWHGAPLKQIELPLYHQRTAKYPSLIRAFFNAYKLLTGRHATNELVVSTSPFFTEKAFRPAFRAKCFADTGYPRNDALFAETKFESFQLPVYINTDRETIIDIMARKKSGSKIILYAPTFRKELAGPFSTGMFDLDRLDAFSRKNHLFTVLKLHPVMAKQMPEGQYSNVAVYDATGDIYPVLNLFDVLITDYSSIYFDYLLLDRPIIFFPYDYENYISSDRSLLFDYRLMTPGPICMNQDELEVALQEINFEKYSENRKEILDLVFTYKDNMASLRLWEILHDRFIS
ncbi:MAG: hypothetical protein C4563_08370, partial [Desulfobulbus sp.]